MASKRSNNVITDTNRIVDTWTANPDFKMGTVTMETITAKRDALGQADEAVEATRTKLAGELNTRDDLALELIDLVTRFRAGLKAVYGANSTQYEQAGGTRKSERASGLHHAAKTAPAR
jgi:hypothetical protein